METDHSQFHWWQKGVNNEVYTRSFQDSDGEGVGCVIICLDYLKWLGVNAVWLTPVTLKLLIINC